MTIEPKNDTVTYKSESGQQTPAPLVVAVGPDGQPTGSVKVTARHVRTINGTTIAGPKEIIGADPSRTGLTIRNDSDAQMYFRTDGEAGDSIGYPMDARRGYSFEALGMIPSDAVSVWCATAGNKWAVLYSTSAA